MDGLLSTLKSAVSVILGDDIIPVGEYQRTSGELPQHRAHITWYQGCNTQLSILRYKCKDVNGRGSYALKRILCQDQASCRQAELEVKIIKKFGTRHNPGIIQYFGACKKPLKETGGTEYFVLMELCRGGTLMDLITKQDGKPLDELELLHIFRKVCEGVRTLHTHKPPVTHRDIKIENLLVVGDGNYRLCDFGSCTTKIKTYSTREEITIEDEAIQRFSTAMYRAPEMADLYRKEELGPKVDIWALGCVLFVLAFYFHPFQEGGNQQIINGTYDVPESHSFSQHLLDVMRRLLCVKLKKRPDIEAVFVLLDEWEGVLTGGGGGVSGVSSVSGYKKKKKLEKEKGKAGQDKEVEDDNQGSNSVPHPLKQFSSTKRDDWDPFGNGTSNRSKHDSRIDGGDGDWANLESALDDGGDGGVSGGDTVDTFDFFAGATGNVAPAVVPADGEDDWACFD